MKALRLIVLALAMAGLAVSSSSAAEVEKLSWRVMDHWLSGSAGQITSRFTNKTIQIKVTRKALGKPQGGPPTGSVILYLAKGGRMLTWTANAKAVGTGRWEIKSMGMDVEIPCFYFDGSKGRSECFFGGTANYVEAATGNVFGLEAGALVPSRLGNGTISGVARKLGL